MDCDRFTLQLDLAAAITELVEHSFSGQKENQTAKESRPTHSRSACLVISAQELVQRQDREAGRWKHCVKILSTTPEVGSFQLPAPNWHHPGHPDPILGGLRPGWPILNSQFSAAFSSRNSFSLLLHQHRATAHFPIRSPVIASAVAIALAIALGAILSARQLL